VGSPQGLRALGLSEQQIGLATRAALAKKLTSPLDYGSLYAMLHAAWTGQPPAGGPVQGWMPKGPS
jgi:maleylacetate reductase